MQRCLQLAELASGDVAPNPMVGAVLVYNGLIIGEGYHKQYGKAHAEVNCIASVKEEDLHLVSQSTLYVSLEPCAHYGKTPPCADLIIEKKIQKVVVGCRDPFIEVNGKGIEKLKAAGIEVELGVLEKECKELNKRFFLFHTEHRPYVVLKWAQTADGKIAVPPPTPPVEELSNTQPPPVGESAITLASSLNEILQPAQSPLGEKGSRLLISNEYTARLVHKWRSSEAAIVVGTNTALYDDPQLSTRHWPGKNPIRIVVDMNLRLPASLQVFNGDVPTIVFNKLKHTLPFEKIDPTKLAGINHYQVTDDVNLVQQMLNGLYRLGVQSILVEGGAQLLQSFIDEGLWDEARIITNEQLFIGQGLSSPGLQNAKLVATETISSDIVRFYQASHI